MAMVMTVPCSPTERQMRSELAHVYWNVAQNHHPMPQEYMEHIPYAIRYTLAQRRRFLFFTEFSASWNGRPGAMP